MVGRVGSGVVAVMVFVSYLKNKILYVVYKMERFLDTHLCQLGCDTSMLFYYCTAVNSLFMFYFMLC